MAVITEGMARVLAVLPLFSVLLSIMGSSCILRAIYRRCRQGQTHHGGRRGSARFGSGGGVGVRSMSSYERLLVGMSVSDIVASTGLALQPFLGNHGSADQTNWSFGNDMTCRIMGTVHQFSLSGMFYYGMLSYYHLCIIRFGMTNQVVAKRVEPFMHALALGWPTGTAIAGAVVDWYDVLDVFPGCWVDNYPRGCDESNSCYSPLIAWLVAGVWAIFFFISLIVNNIVIFRYVRRIYRSSYRTDSSIAMDNNPARSSTRGRSYSAGSENDERNSNNNNSSAFFSGSMREDNQERRIRMVATQGSLYVYAFLATYSTYFLLQILESYGVDRRHGTQIYFLLLLQAVMTPLAGFFNALIFFRPSYMAIRSLQDSLEDPDTSTNALSFRFQAARLAVLGRQRSGAAAAAPYWRPKPPRRRRRGGRRNRQRPARWENVLQQQDVGRNSNNNASHDDNNHENKGENNRSSRNNSGNDDYDVESENQKFGSGDSRIRYLEEESAGSVELFPRGNDAMEDQDVLEAESGDL